MNKELAEAQVATLAEWADLWQRDGMMSAAEGARDVSFFLRRAAKQICLAMDLPVDESQAMLPEPAASTDELRAG